MSSTQFHIPGAYYFDAPPSSAPAPLTANIFRPPVSPSVSTSVLNSVSSDAPNPNPPTRPPIRRPSGRKRTRDDVTRESTPLTEWSHMGRAETPVDNGGRQIRYTLAGHIETPGSGAVTNPMDAGLEDSVYSDVDYRRAMGSKRGYKVVESPSERRSSLGVGTISAVKNAPAAQGWTVLGALGGAVGKVWDFCKGGAFRGFYAGGGKGYEMDASGSVSASDWNPPSPSDPIRQHRDVPGQFPSDFSSHDRTPAYDDYCTTPETTPRPGAKRRQVSEAGDELRKNWIMVEERRSRSSMPTTTASRPASRKQPHVHQPAHPRPTATRKISTPISRLNSNQYPSRRAGSGPRISHAGSPSLAPREPASFAAPRSPSRTSPAPSSRIPIPSHSTNPFARAASPRPGSRASGALSPQPPGGGHRRSHSNASAASTTSRRKIGVGEIKASPRLDAEAKQLAMGKLARDRDAEERMDAFSLRLRDMIRQGKEALGTRVEVDDEGDEAWLDDG